MHNIEVPNSVALIMLGILAIVAASYTFTGIRTDKNRKDLSKYSGILIIGMVVGGAIGLGLALASKLQFGEFWEFWPTLGGCVLGGFIASYVYARKGRKTNK